MSCGHSRLSGSLCLLTSLRNSTTRSAHISLIRQERILFIPSPATLIAYLGEHKVSETGQAASLVGAALLIALRHSLHVGDPPCGDPRPQDGDPYGTMIQPPPAVAVDVIILAMQCRSCRDLPATPVNPS